ncbi:glycosyltransferase family 4 protein [Dysgonomonas sp. OttesenSCG-928-M03]|nr:glycosyltransferase family 4 protein [Dysgonomonas sp. OttesenSCG-928-M03]
MKNLNQTGKTLIDIMKIVYCLIDSSKAGGMERSICSKANYLADEAGYDVTIITTDRRNKPNFYEFSPNIKFIDLGIGYDKLDSMPFLSKLTTQIKKMKTHKEKLIKILFSIKPDITISTYTHELSILPRIKDGSKKIAEIHFSKAYKKIEYSNHSKLSLKRIFTLIADRRKQWFLRKYDSVVVLTRADKELCQNLPKVEAIPNMVPFYPDEKSNCEQKQIISVGRLTFIKGYNLLIDAWSKIAQKYPDWQLFIYGEGEDRLLLKREIGKKRLDSSVSILSASHNIDAKYLNSSIYVMPSLVEGFGVVLTEAMACGLPCISFDCPTGPAEIITHGEDGLLVEYKNTDKLAEAISFLIEEKSLRKEMGENARENVRRFSPERIMPRWISLFQQITGTSEY